MRSELRWGVSREIVVIHSMSVVCMFWNVLECFISFLMNLCVFERFETFWNVFECINMLLLNVCVLNVLKRYGMFLSV